MQRDLSFYLMLAKLVCPLQLFRLLLLLFGVVPYISMYIHTYAHTHIHTHAHTYACMHAHTYAHTVLDVTWWQKADTFSSAAGNHHHNLVPWFCIRWPFTRQWPQAPLAITFTPHSKWMNECMCVCICIYARTDIHMYAHTFIHSFIHSFAVWGKCNSKWCLWSLFGKGSAYAKSWDKIVVVISSSATERVSLLSPGHI